jgi:hypothetical protein
MPIVWTDELKERVKGLWGTNSAAEIAAQLRADGYDISRGSIVGVLRRMGLSAKNKIEDHPSACNANRSKPRAPKAASAVLALFSKARTLESLRGPANVHGISALEPHHCRYLLGDDARNPIYCGHASVDGKSYCPVHCAVVYLPREERRVAA